MIHNSKHTENALWFVFLFFYLNGLAVLFVTFLQHCSMFSVSTQDGIIGLGDAHFSSSSAFPAVFLRFTILLLLFRFLGSQLYLLGSPFFFFFCFVFYVPSYISGVHHSSSSSASSSTFPAISLGFTIFLPLLLLRCSQLYHWGSPFFFFFFCIPC